MKWKSNIKPGTLAPKSSTMIDLNTNVTMVPVYTPGAQLSRFTRNKKQTNTQANKLATTITIKKKDFKKQATIAN